VCPAFECGPMARNEVFEGLAGVLEEIVGRLLNHTPLSITGQRYAMPSLDALRPSMDLACTELKKRSGGL
jgi:hypothetical protein